MSCALFSTSDFICIGIVAAPLTMVIVSGGMDISLVHNRAMRAFDCHGMMLFQLGMPLTFSDYYYPTARRNMWATDKCGLIIYTVKPVGDYHRNHVFIWW